MKFSDLVAAFENANTISVFDGVSGTFNYLRTNPILSSALADIRVASIVAHPCKGDDTVVDYEITLALAPVRV